VRYDTISDNGYYLDHLDVGVRLVEITSLALHDDHDRDNERGQHKDPRDKIEDGTKDAQGERHSVDRRGQDGHRARRGAGVQAARLRDSLCVCVSVDWTCRQYERWCWWARKQGVKAYLRVDVAASSERRVPRCERHQLRAAPVSTRHLTRMGT